MAKQSGALQSAKRVALAVVAVAVAVVIGYVLWSPGNAVRDGRNDRGSNGIWLAHGWLGGDEWFLEKNKTNEFARYRSVESIKASAEKLRRQGIKDVFRIFVRQVARQIHHAQANRLRGSCRPQGSSSLADFRVATHRIGVQGFG